MNLMQPKYLLVAALAILAAFALAGHPLIDPASVAGLGMIAVGNTTTMDEVKAVADKLGLAFDDFKAKQVARLDALEAHLVKGNRPGIAGKGTSATPAAWIDTKSGKPVRVLEKGDSLAAIEGKGEGGSVGRFLRGVVCGEHAPDARELADERKALNIGTGTAGGFTVTDSIAAQWVDALRAQSVLARAGAGTVMMPAGELGIARIDTDPTVSWHGESASITATQPVFGRVNLQARTAVCVVPFSVELAQDSANLEAQLERVVTNALAAALDAAGLVGTSTDAGAAPAGLVNLSGRNSVLAIGTPANYDHLVDALAELMVDNVDQASIGPLVAHPLLLKKYLKLRTGIASDVSPLPAPAEIAAIPRLWTTALPSSKAILANWRDVIVGMRQAVTVKVIDSRMASNLEGTLVAYLRADVGCVRPASVCTLEGFTGL